MVASMSCLCMCKRRGGEEGRGEEMRGDKRR